MSGQNKYEIMKLAWSGYQISKAWSMAVVENVRQSSILSTLLFKFAIGKISKKINFETNIEK